MALTFDDGPWSQYTADVLDVLGRHGVQSTFFMVGQRVAAVPSMARRVWEEGHEIGVHTQHHAALSKLGPNRQNLEITQNWEAIQLAVPQAAIHLWRAPYGDVPKPMPSAVVELGLKHMAWTIDTNDWRGGSDLDFQNSIFQHARDGAVVLMHEHTPLTRRNLETIIIALQEAGYQLVTVSSLKDPACGGSAKQHSSAPRARPPASASPALLAEPVQAPVDPLGHLAPPPPSKPVEEVPVDELPTILNY